MKTFNTFQELSLASVLTGTPVRIISPTLVDGVVYATGEGFALPSGNVFVPRFDDQEALTGRKTSLLDDAFVGNVSTYINLYSKNSNGDWVADADGLTSNVSYNGQIWEPINEVAYNASGYLVSGWNFNVVDPTVLEIVTSTSIVIQFRAYSGNADVSTSNVVAAGSTIGRRLEDRFADAIQIFDTVSDMVAGAGLLAVGYTVKTRGYYVVNDGGAAEYLMTAGNTGDGAAHHNVGTLTAEIQFEDFVTAAQIGNFTDTIDCSINQNLAQPIVKHIKYEGDADYNIRNTIYVEWGDKITTHGSGGDATFIMQDDTFRGNLIESRGFPNVAQRWIELDKIKVEGNLTSWTQAEIDGFSGTEGIGFALTVGTSRLSITSSNTAGIGMCFSNGGDSNLYVHGNYLVELHALDSGQEGIIMDGCLDSFVKYAQSYFAWNSRNDTDFTSTKVSKYTTYTHAAGILFWKGSCEIELIHPSNNRHGYAWAASNNNYRLRFNHMIGEGSAAGMRCEANSTIVGSLMNLHSTRGKGGLPLGYINGFDAKNIDNLHIRIDSQIGYPTTGTAGGLVVEGSRVNLPNLIINGAGGQLEVGSNALQIKGDEHKINATIYNFATDTTGVAGSGRGVAFAYPVTNADITLKFDNVGLALSGASANTDIGKLTCTFNNVTTDISTWLSFVTDDFLRRNDWYNFDTEQTTRPQTHVQTLINTDTDGTDNFYSVNTLNMYQTPQFEGFSFKGATSSFRLGSSHKLAVYQSAQTSTGGTIRYVIDGSEGGNLYTRYI